MKDEDARYLYLREEMAVSDEISRLMTAKEEGEKASKEDRQRDSGNDGKIMDIKKRDFTYGKMPQVRISLFCIQFCKNLFINVKSNQTTSGSSLQNW